jgi:hypothetical protein
LAIMLFLHIDINHISSTLSLFSTKTIFLKSKLSLHHGISSENTNILSYSPIISTAFYSNLY